MATKKTATKSATKSTAARAKALTPRDSSRLMGTAPKKAPAPPSLNDLIARQDAAHRVWMMARTALTHAVNKKNADPAHVDALALAQIEAREAFDAARFARWGAMHAERAIKRGKEPMPPSMMEESHGVVSAMIAQLEAVLAYESGKVRGRDEDRIAGTRAALVRARALLR